jgi:hypothetical protein
LRAFALSDLGAGVGYVVKYLTKVHKTIVEEKFDRKSVLTLAMMWIFKKRAFSLSRGARARSESHQPGKVRFEGSLSPISSRIRIGLNYLTGALRLR